MPSMRLWCTIFAVLLCTSVNAQVAEIITQGSSVQNVADGLTDNLKELIETTEDSTNIVVMNTRSQASILIEQLYLLADQFLGRQFDSLNEAEKQIFVNAQNLLQLWNDGDGDNLEKIRNLNREVAATLSQIPGTEQEPRVLSYNPAYAVSGFGKQHTISVQGQWLDYGDPILAFGSTQCQRVEKLTNSLKFSCPDTILSTTQLQLQIGTLILYKQLGLFDWLKSLFSNESQNIRTFQLIISSVPVTIGNYSIIANVSSEIEDRVHRTQNFFSKNAHCSGTRRPPWSASPARDYEIDISSVKHTVTNRSEKSQLNAVKPSSSAIDVQVSIVNRGSCGPRVFGQRVGNDARGSIGISLVWDDVKKSTVTIGNDLDEGSIEWSKDVLIPLPENTVSWSIIVEHPDGSISTADQAMKYRWFSISQTGQNLVISPNLPEEVFGR